MRVLVLAVGRMKKGAEAELCARYFKRARDAGRQVGIRDIEIVEIRESRAQEAERRKIEESVALTSLIPEDAVVAILDERGESLGSAAFADHIRRWRDGGHGTLVFVIGGPDGLADRLRENARSVFGFGAASWPHQLVRIMLLEQLYRAVTILSGHPYHRE
jgi:23S rRNA (pseudouridine1915-N3)-methyltransferase